MSVMRARKEASKRLGLAMYLRYKALVEAAGDDDAVIAASVELGQLFNDNIEFIIWALKTFGGLTPPIPDPVRQKGLLQ